MEYESDDNQEEGNAHGQKQTAGSILAHLLSTANFTAVAFGQIEVVVHEMLQFFFDFGGRIALRYASCESDRVFEVLPSNLRRTGFDLEMAQAIQR